MAWIGLAAESRHESPVSTQPIDSIWQRIQAMQKKIYLFQRKSDLSLKIGISSNPVKRLSQVQNGSACELSLIHETCMVSNPSEIESKIHACLAQFKMSGEWFSCEYKYALDCVNENMRLAKTENHNSVFFVEISALWAATNTNNPNCCAAALLMAENVSDKEFYSGLIFIKHFIEGVCSASDLIYSLHMDKVDRALKRIEKLQLGFEII